MGTLIVSLVCLHFRGHIPGDLCSYAAEVGLHRPLPNFECYGCLRLLRIDEKMG
jgi:hypothetical protein